MVVYYDEDNFSIKLYRDCVSGELIGLTEVIPIDELLEVWADHKTERVMKFKEYEILDGRKAVFEYDENGDGKINLECMDELMGMIADRPQGKVDAVEIYERAERRLERSEISLGEFESIIDPLRRLYYDRPQGEWKPKNHHTDYCSNCGFEETQWRTVDYNFCPSCGARMKGADDEH